MENIYVIGVPRPKGEKQDTPFKFQSVRFFLSFWFKVFLWFIVKTGTQGHMIGILS